MATLHQLSACCRAPIRRYGGRRRQCVSCRRTWRLSKHKRGRDPKRCASALLERVLLKGQTVEDQASRYPRLTIHALHKRVQKLIRLFLKKPIAPLPLQEKYTLIADGLWYAFQGKRWVLFLPLLKPISEGYAYLLDPFILQGKESYENWRAALERALPQELRARVIAFVSDDFRASRRIADEQGWIHQLCHFHLIAALQSRRGRWKRKILSVPLREDIYQNIRYLLETTKGEEIPSRISRLQEIATHPECPGKLQGMTREFLRTLPRYRNYLTYPAYNIPRTTSAVESWGKIVRRSTRHLKTPSAVQDWATAIARLRKTVICNGASKRDQPN